MTKRRTFGIVGGGLAGAGAAATLRAEGFDGRVVLVSEELWMPYERPPLTKDFLAGASVASAAYVHPPSFYAEHDIELMAGAQATGYDAATGDLELDHAAVLRCEALLLASGSASRRIPLSGGDADNVLTIRTFDDASRARERLTPGAHVVCIGAGWSGMEVAATARNSGCEVTVVDPGPVPLANVLGEQIGRFYRLVHETHGVTFRMGRSVVVLSPADGGTAIELDNGDRLAAELVVIGIGATPRVSLLADAGAALELGGVATDASLRTSLPNVFAAGDVAAAWHPLLKTHVRVEHWANALYQGPLAARNMLGAEEEYDRLPYFYSDQYDLSMEYAGLAGRADRVILRGDMESRSFAAFWIDEQQCVVAGMTVNLPGEIDAVEQLVRRRVRADLTALADPETSLDRVPEMT
jgi:3-phenylpropionate/trans-cinnamate dioxygenase ferredoxin reductase component